jgi:acyl-CoA synthetase (NDP forming)
MSRLQKLLKPNSIALIGGQWADAVVEANRTLGYTGTVWRVHPTREGCFRSVAELPGAPDATFVGVGSREVPAIARELSTRGAGPFVCFASGYEETADLALTRELVGAAGGIPFLGTNCYGLINYFDGVALWPDTLTRQRPERGVAIITQSGGLGIGLTHNQRSLPLGYLISVGNQTDVAIEDLIEELSVDERVSAIGLYVEGIRNAGRFRQAVAVAQRAGIPVAAIKGGRTDWSVQTALIHTASIAGDDQAFDHLCAELGIARCDTVATLIETLKVLHMGGPLRGSRVLAMAASAGYAILTSDVARDLALDFAPMPKGTLQGLSELLGPRIVLSNPFDFQTLHWHDQAKMRAMCAALFEAEYDAITFMFGYPTASGADTSAYDMPILEYIDLAGHYATRATVLAPLPEFFGAKLRDRCIRGGVVPLQGHREGLQALSLAAQARVRRGAASEDRLSRPLATVV